MDHMAFLMGQDLYGIVFWSIIVFVVFVLIRNVLKH